MNFDLCQRPEIIQVGVYMHPYDDNGDIHRRPFEGRHLVDTLMERCSRVLQHWILKSWIFPEKSSKWTKLNFVRTPIVCTPRKESPWLRRYQSYISNWYINGKVFASTTAWKHKNLNYFQKSSKLNFDLYFDLCQIAEIIEVVLNINLYDDIRDASSSLWGSTSS